MLAQEHRPERVAGLAHGFGYGDAVDLGLVDAGLIQHLLQHFAGQIVGTAPAAQHDLRFPVAYDRDVFAFSHHHSFAMRRGR